MDELIQFSKQFSDLQVCSKWDNTCVEVTSKLHKIWKRSAEIGTVQNFVKCIIVKTEENTVKVSLEMFGNVLEELFIDLTSEACLCPNAVLKSKQIIAKVSWYGNRHYYCPGLAP